MKALLTGIGVALGLVGLAPNANAFPGDPLDFVYVTYLSNHGVTVPDNMIEAAGQFARQICGMAATGSPLGDIDTLVHVHFDNVGPIQTRAIELGAAQVYCPPRKSYSSQPVV